MKYDLRIQESLLFSIKFSSKHPNHRILSFFDEKVCEMIAAEPNIKSYKHKKFEKLKKVENPVWIVRGYYPGTPVFFKLVVVRPSPIEVPDLLLVKAIDPNKPKMLTIKSDVIRNESAECELLGHDMEMSVKKQRLMMPKGVKPCKFEKKQI